MSKPRRILLAPEALMDVDRLDAFLRSVSTVAADRLQDELLVAFEAIRDHPFAGRRWTHCPMGRDIREQVVPFCLRGYVTRYEITAFDIVIARIYHGLEDREPK